MKLYAFGLRELRVKPPTLKKSPKVMNVLYVLTQISVEIPLQKEAYGFKCIWLQL